MSRRFPGAAAAIILACNLTASAVPMLVLRGFAAERPAVDTSNVDSANVDSANVDTSNVDA